MNIKELICEKCGKNPLWQNVKWFSGDLEEELITCHCTCGEEFKDKKSLKAIIKIYIDSCSDMTSEIFQNFVENVLCEQWVGINPQKREYDKLIKAGNIAQIEKLQKNDHKRGFEDIELTYAFKRLKEEMKELKSEEIRYDMRISCEKECGVPQEDMKEVLVNIRNEAADIANFAHMIIYKCDQLLKKEQNNAS